MEKRDGRAGRAASQTRETGEGQERTSRPSQTQREPHSAAGERSHRHGQPDQFVIEPSGGEPAPHNSHLELSHCQRSSYLSHGKWNAPPELAISIPKTAAKIPQQTIIGKKIARRALAVVVSWARVRPIHSSTML